MFASFLWTVSFITVCSADALALENRLKALQLDIVEEAILLNSERRRDGGEEDTLEAGVQQMAAQAGFRYKDCIEAAPFGGFSKFILVAWAPAILGDLMSFETDRRRWGFNKNNFITNIAQPLAGVDCEDVYEECTSAATLVYQNGLEQNQAEVAANYPFVSSKMDYFTACAAEEILDICADYKNLVCLESAGN